MLFPFFPYGNMVRAIQMAKKSGELNRKMSINMGLTERDMRRGNIGFLYLLAEIISLRGEDVLPEEFINELIDRAYPLREEPFSLETNLW